MILTISVLTSTIGALLDNHFLGYCYRYLCFNVVNCHIFSFKIFVWVFCSLFPQKIFGENVCIFVPIYKYAYDFQQVGEECRKGGVRCMLLEVGQVSCVVLTKSEWRKYQRRT